MATVASTTRVVITAPDAAAAFMLDRGLAHHAPMVVGRGEGWAVELEAEGVRFEELAEAVRRWLRDEALPETTVFVDDEPRVLRRHSA
jgi:hypothetical protein